MDHADRIRKIGFKRWYERQLIHAHMYLVTAFLSLILALSCVEAFSDGGPALQRIGMLATGLISVLVSLLAVDRFWRALSRTVHLGERAGCPACAAYGRFNILAAGAPRRRAGILGAPTDVAALEGTWLRVQCRNCAHTWLID